MKFLLTGERFRPLRSGALCIKPGGYEDAEGDRESSDESIHSVVLHTVWFMKIVDMIVFFKVPIGKFILVFKD